MYRIAIAALGALICCASTPHGNGYLPTTLFDIGSREAVAIPATFTEEGIVVRVGIAGRDLNFMLDSGSPYSVLDSQVARSLGISSAGVAKATFGGDYTIASGRAPSITVGDLRATNVAISTASVRGAGTAFRIDGLLGADFFWSGPVEVDFETGHLILHRSIPPGLRAAGWSSVPLRLDWGVPLIAAAFNGRDGSFIADLGSDESVLYRPYFSQLRVVEPPGSYNGATMYTLAGKPVPIEHFVMKRLALGDWIFGDAEVVVPYGQFAQGRSYDGLLGRNALSHLKLIFDYKGRTLWFKPIDTGASK